MINGIGTSTTSLLGGVGGGSTQVGGINNRPAASREDSGAVSTTASRIAAEGAPIDLDRVATLRAAIKSGSYRPNPQAIADSMIAADIGGGQA